MMNPEAIIRSPYVRKNPSENVLPRLLTIKQTASYWGVSQNGIALGPVHTTGFNRLLFDREQQDRAMDALRQSRA